MKWLIIVFIVLMLAVAGCAGTASYSRDVNGTINATNGSFNLILGPDGKTIIGESFTPTSGSAGGVGLGQLIQLLQALTGASSSMAVRQVQGGQK